MVLIYAGVMAMDWNALLDAQFAGVTLRQVVIASALFVIVIMGIRIVIGLVIARLKVLSAKTKTDLDDAVVESVRRLFAWPVYLVAALVVSGRALPLPEFVWRVLNYAAIIVVCFYVVRALMVFVDFGVRRAMQKNGNGKDVDEGTLHIFSGLIKIAMWVIAIIFVISNLGYNVASLVAGLGIGGIAIGFALQNILSDIFASFSIYLDKPFKVGDFIMIGTDSGTVQKIGIKSTRIRTLQGEELIVSNKELTESRVNNFKKLERRRVVFSVGVTYDTSQAKVEKIPKVIAAVVKAQKLAELDRVHFKAFGDFALIYEIVYFVGSKEYVDYMDTQQAINFGIKKAFEKERIEMAFPTQTVYVHKA
ncbi:MAG: mechanosensitive ion channel family protein [Nitrosarchaeum sp.]|nr:mechanosensitive ion channel family protein [Nitrosarchaeum sp.]